VSGNTKQGSQSASAAFGPTAAPYSSCSGTPRSARDVSVLSWEVLQRPYAVSYAPIYIHYRCATSNCHLSGIVLPHVSHFQHPSIYTWLTPQVNAHNGNVQFRNLVLAYSREYFSDRTRKLDKALICDRVVEHFAMMDPPGRFLRQDPGTMMWTVVDKKTVYKKVGQAFRDCRGQVIAKSASREISGPAPVSSGEDAFRSAPSHSRSASASSVDWEPIESAIVFDDELGIDRNEQGPYHLRPTLEDQEQPTDGAYRKFVEPQVVPQQHDQQPGSGNLTNGTYGDMSETLASVPGQGQSDIPERYPVASADREIDICMGMDAVSGNRGSIAGNAKSFDQDLFMHNLRQRYGHIMFQQQCQQQQGNQQHHIQYPHASQSQDLTRFHRSIPSPPPSSSPGDIEKYSQASLRHRQGHEAMKQQPEYALLQQQAVYPQHISPAPRAEPSEGNGIKYDAAATHSRRISLSQFTTDPCTRSHDSEKNANSSVSAGEFYTRTDSTPTDHSTTFGASQSNHFRHHLHRSNGGRTRDRPLEESLVSFKGGNAALPKRRQVGKQESARSA